MVDRQNENLLEALRAAQETLERCDVYYGEASDDSCRAIYSRIKDMLQEQQRLVQEEIESHKRAGKWKE